MNTEVTQILGRIEEGDPNASKELLPLVYDELRRLASARMAAERPEHTLQATALVHEAYIRLVDSNNAAHWDSSGHFFAAAAEAMRRILVQHYRNRNAQKRGGGRARLELSDSHLGNDSHELDLVDLNDAIDELTANDPDCGSLAKLRIFAGLSIDEAAAAIGIPRTSAYRQWTYAQAWLRARLQDS